MAEVNPTRRDFPSTSDPSYVDIEVDVEVPITHHVQSQRLPVIHEAHESSGSVNSEEDVLSTDVNPYPAIFNCHRLSQIIVASTIIITLALLIVSFSTPRQKTDNVCQLTFTVSKNGTSDFRTISEAVEASPSYSVFTICILIKKGEYRETVKIGYDKTSLLLKGEGIDETMISSNASSNGDGDGWTLWVGGEGFLSRDLTISNLAKDGVAVENWAFRSVFFKCRFLGTNETLHAERKSHLYHSCEFHGRNYLVTGDAAAYFHNCNFYMAKSSPNEKVVFAGQSRNLLTSNTGFTFHHCGFYTFDRSINNPESIFLGSALGECAAIIVIQSFLDTSIGGYWIDASPPNTTYFAIFENTGGGAAMKVVPPLVQVLNDVEASSKFSLKAFTSKGNWTSLATQHDLDLS